MTKTKRQPSEIRCRTAEPCTAEKPCGATTWSNDHPFTASLTCGLRAWHHNGQFCNACKGWG